MAIDYDAGRGRRGAYQNLADALQTKLDAQNRREAEDIRRKGLFGTGITQDNLNSLAKTGLAVANFGDQRKTSKLSRAKESFDRRMAGMQKRFDFYNARKDEGSQEVARGLMDAMNRERANFEKAYTDYDEMGMFESKFGGEGIAYKGPDTQATEQKLLQQIMANRNQQEKREEKTPGPVTNQFGEQGRGTGYGPLPGGGMMGGVTTPVQNTAGYGMSEEADKIGGMRNLRGRESFISNIYPDSKYGKNSVFSRNAMRGTDDLLNKYSLGSGYQA
tara:strand:- start:801 stop:1625 length:825 start_codon:yes stop_codon:yes gene_type:complete